MARVMGAKPVNFDRFCQIFTTPVEPATLKLVCPKKASLQQKIGKRKFFPKTCETTTCRCSSIDATCIRFEQQKQKLHPSDGCRYTSPRPNPDHANVQSCLVGIQRTRNDTKKNKQNNEKKNPPSKFQNLTIPCQQTKKVRSSKQKSSPFV